MVHFNISEVPYQGAGAEGFCCKVATFAVPPEDENMCLLTVPGSPGESTKQTWQQPPLCVTEHMLTEVNPIESTVHSLMPV